MFLIMHNIPTHFGRIDLKSFITDHCGISEIIVDNMLAEGGGQRATIGVADEQDFSIIFSKLNGLYIHGNQLFIERSCKKLKADTPYTVGSHFNQPMNMPQHHPVIPPLAQNTSVSPYYGNGPTFQQTSEQKYFGSHQLAFQVPSANNNVRQSLRINNPGQSWVNQSSAPFINVTAATYSRHVTNQSHASNYDTHGDCKNQSLGSASNENNTLQHVPKFDFNIPRNDKGGESNPFSHMLVQYPAYHKSQQSFEHNKRPSERVHFSRFDKPRCTQSSIKQSPSKNSSQEGLNKFFKKSLSGRIDDISKRYRTDESDRYDHRNKQPRYDNKAQQGFSFKGKFGGRSDAFDRFPDARQEFRSHDPRKFPVTSRSEKKQRYFKNTPDRDDAKVAIKKKNNERFSRPLPADRVESDSLALKVRKDIINSNTSKTLNANIATKRNIALFKIIKEMKYSCGHESYLLDNCKIMKQVQIAIRKRIKKAISDCEVENVDSIISKYRERYLKKFDNNFLHRIDVKVQQLEEMQGSQSKLQKVDNIVEKIEEIQSESPPQDKEPTKLDNTEVQEDGDYLLPGPLKKSMDEELDAILNCIKDVCENNPREDDTDEKTCDKIMNLSLEHIKKAIYVNAMYRILDITPEMSLLFTPSLKYRSAFRNFLKKTYNLYKKTGLLPRYYIGKCSDQKMYDNVCAHGSVIFGGKKIKVRPHNFDGAQSIGNAVLNNFDKNENTEECNVNDDNKLINENQLWEELLDDHERDSDIKIENVDEDAVVNTDDCKIINTDGDIVELDGDVKNEVIDVDECKEEAPVDDEDWKDSLIDEDFEMNEDELVDY